MNAKNAKILRQGAEIFNLSYGDLKRAFKKLTKPEREKFLARARRDIYGR